MCALSPDQTSEPGLEAGLPIEEIEARLSVAATRHHLEERNIAYWLFEIEERGLHKKRGFSSIGDYAMQLVGIKPRKAQYLVFIASRLQKLPLIRAQSNAARSRECTLGSKQGSGWTRSSTETRSALLRRSKCRLWRLASCC